MNTTLHICAADGEPLASLISSNGVVTIASGTDRMRRAATRWIREGLAEWIRTAEAASPRLTLSSDPTFLLRLSKYLETQFSFGSNFVYELNEQPRLEARVSGSSSYAPQLQPSPVLQRVPFTLVSSSLGSVELAS